MYIKSFIPSISSWTMEKNRLKKRWHSYLIEFTGISNETQSEINDFLDSIFGKYLVHEGSEKQHNMHFTQLYFILVASNMISTKFSQIVSAETILF